MDNEELQDLESETVEATEDDLEMVVAGDLGDALEEGLDEDQDDVLTGDPEQDLDEDQDAVLTGNPEQDLDEDQDAVLTGDPEQDADEDQDAVLTGNPEQDLDEDQDDAPELDADAETPAEATVEAEAKPEGDRLWYVIHSYSGYENKVKRNLEHRAESMHDVGGDRVFQVIVPTEEEIELRDGKRRRIERRVFPGYILVDMIMDEDSWYVVRNTPGVTGFVGMGNKPTPLTQEEVDKIMRRIEDVSPKIKINFKAGQKVRLVGGPFADFTGVVDEISPEKGKARVMVSFFGRETPVEVDFLQLEKV